MISATRRACTISASGRRPLLDDARAPSADAHRRRTVGDRVHERRHRGRQLRAARRGRGARSRPDERHLITPRIEHEAVLNTVKALGKPRLDGDAASGRHHRASSRPTRSRAAITRRHGARLGDAREQRDRDDPADRRARGASRTSTARCFTPTRCSRPGRSRSTCARWASICCRSRPTSSTARKAPARSGSGAACGWSPTMTGGKHERNRRAGTENVPGIAGLGRRRAARPRRKLAADAARLAALRDRLERGILANVAGHVVNGARDAARAEHHEHQLRRRRGRVAADRARSRGLRGLDRIGVFVGTLEPSHVLRAMGLPAAPHAELDPIQPRRGQRRRRRSTSL